MDDILVKTREQSHLIPDLEETFATLRGSGMQLNPAKCTFGVKNEKFLGIMVTEKGIEVNPGKIATVMEMPSPKNVRDVQRLNGKIVALTRFISRSVHRSHPFFQVFRKAQKFGWDNKCEQAFLSLKNHLANLPILSKPEAGENLWVYLSATKNYVSSVLICEE